MNTVIFKMTFQTPVHFGEGRLGSSKYTFDNQRLFSALFLEMLRSSESEAKTLYDKCSAGHIMFSDAFPYIGDRFYLPRPLSEVKIEGDRDQIKALKSLPYIAADSLEKYLEGHFDPILEREQFSGLGEYAIHQRVFIKSQEDNEPYFVGSFSYNADSGLYFILSSKEEDDIFWFDDWMTVLGESGIGGKRTSGYGSFAVVYDDVNLLGKAANRVGRKGKNNMSLGFSFPKDSELKILNKGNFTVSKKSGFVMSEALNPPQKKKRFYGIASGSVFPEIYDGDIFDVSSTDMHPVYLYAKPLWMEVSREETL